MRLEEFLSRPGRLRIVLALLEHGSLNITRLVRLVRLSHKAVEKHLRALTRYGLVREHRLGRVRLLSLDMDKPEARLLRAFVREWRSLPRA